MATLNTLRTKFGIVLSIVIALALLAFILSLKTEMGFSGNNPKVGVIAGDKITYTDYYDRYEQIKMQNGGNDVYDENSEERLAAATWQALIADHVVVPGFERMGLTVTDAERMSMLSGEHPSGVYYSAFADPATGYYDVAAIAEFLSQADTNLQMQQMWQSLNSQARLEREVMKYAGLVKGGAYVNKLEVDRGVRNANKTFTGKVVSRKYSSLPDSLFTVSASDIKKYYNDHKASYKQQPFRSISYVVFEVEPTQADMADIENSVRAVAAEFEVADDVRAFVRQNRGTVADNYVSGDQLPTDEAEALLAGRMYGPVLENDTWKVSRVADVKTAPDSLGLRHIVLSYNEEALADSLLTAVRNGADFAEAARDHSLAQTAANGGDLGVMPFSALPKDFAEALASAKTGDKVKIQSGNMIQLIDVYRAGKASKHVNVARIETPVEASMATKRTVHNAASTFTVNAKGSVEKFNAAASEAAVTTRVASVADGERTVRGLDRSHEIVRWAFGAKKGDVSEIFNIGKDYVVAILTDIDNNDYKSINSVQNQIRSAVLRDKKYERIVSEVSGTDLASIGEEFGTEVAEFKDLNYASYYIPGVGFEPRFVGAVAASTACGVLSEPVKGSSGVFYFVVDEVNDAEKQTADAERVRLQAMAEGMAQQAATSLAPVTELANVKYMSSRYF